MSVNIPFTEIPREERGETFHLKDIPIIGKKNLHTASFTDDKSDTQRY